MTQKPIDQAQARAEQQAVEATLEYQAEQMAWSQVEDELFAILDAEDEAAAQNRNATTHCQDGSWW